MVWVSGLLPYGKAAQVFERIGHRQIPMWSLWNQTQHHGARLKTYLECQDKCVGVERVKLPPPSSDHGIRKGVSMDGGMVNIRGEGWKEVKVGTVFDVDIRLERDHETRELVERPHGTNMEYTAVLGSVGEFAPSMWALAWRHDIPTAANSSVTADGAEWIWNLADDLFPDSVQIVDWYHACEHLASASHTLYPDDDAAARRWFRRGCTHLYRGEVHKIARPLDNAGHTDQSRYFHMHKRRMQYQTCLEDGYPIGSGTVESGVKQFKERLTGAGMRWSRRSAEEMLVIRAAIMGQRFDALWNVA